MFETQSISPCFNFDIVIDTQDPAFIEPGADEFPDDVIEKQQGIICYSSRGSHKHNNDKYDYIINSDFIIAAVYDGHGDSTVSIYLKENLLKNIINHAKFTTSPAESITESIKLIEQQVIDKFDSTSGSTLLITLWRNDYIIVANVGDGYCYGFKNDEQQLDEQADKLRQNQKGDMQIGKKNKRFQLNEIHNLEIQNQRIQIQKKGGFILKRKNSYRVAGQLNLSRSIGDKKYKKWISAVPSVKQYPSSFSHILLASDGFSKQLELVKESISVYELMQKAPYLVDNSSFILIKKPSQFK